MLGRQFCLTTDERGFELPKIATCFDDNCDKYYYHMKKIQEHVFLSRHECFIYIFHVALGGMIHSEAGPYRESHVHLQYFLMKRAI